MNNKHSTIHIIFRSVVTAFLFFGFASSSTAIALQEELTVVQAPAVEVVEFKDNLGRDTPRSSFIGFLSATEEFDYASAVQFMDMRNLPHAARRVDAEELARQLDFIIQRGMKINVDQLSSKVTGQVVDGLPDYRDELGRLIGDEGEQVLYMQKVPGLDDNFIWKVSNASIALVPELYDYFSYPAWIEYFRENLPSDSSFLGVEFFKWVIVLGMIGILLPAFWIIGYILSRLISKPGAPLFVPIRKLLTRPVPILAIGLISGSLLRELGLGARAQELAESRTLVTLIVVWLIFSLIDLARAKRRERFIAEGREDAHILGRPLAHALKLLTLLGAFLVWLSNSGVEISALLAGLGVGGVALALALQKPIEDLLGAVSLYSQQPMQTGDLCKYGDILGSIEEIGLRTTRIRTLSDTLVSVPNCIIAHGAIENFSKREKMLYHPDLPLRFDTTLEQMQTVIDGIDAVARAHTKVIEKSVRVRFVQFSSNALIIKVRVYVDESDFSNYLEVVSELNMSIMKVVENAGAHFAEGASTVMLEYGNTSEPQTAPR